MAKRRPIPTLTPTLAPFCPEVSSRMICALTEAAPTHRTNNSRVFSSRLPLRRRIRFGSSSHITRMNRGLTLLCTQWRLPRSVRTRSRTTETMCRSHAHGIWNRPPTTYSNLPSTIAIPAGREDLCHHPTRTLLENRSFVQCFARPPRRIIAFREKRPPANRKGPFSPAPIQVCKHPLVRRGGPTDGSRLGRLPVSSSGAPDTTLRPRGAGQRL